MITVAGAVLLRYIQNESDILDLEWKWPKFGASNFEIHHGFQFQSSKLKDSLPNAGGCSLAFVLGAVVFFAQQDSAAILSPKPRTGTALFTNTLAFLCKAKKTDGWIYFPGLVLRGML